MKLILEDKGDGKGPKMVSFFAKRARGALARHIIENGLTSPQDMIDVTFDGYTYQEAESTQDRPVFWREEVHAKAG